MSVALDIAKVVSMTRMKIIQPKPCYKRIKQFLCEKVPNRGVAETTLERSDDDLKGEVFNNCLKNLIKVGGWLSEAQQEPGMTSQIIIRLMPHPEGSAKAVVSFARLNYKFQTAKR